MPVLRGSLFKSLFSDTLIFFFLPPSLPPSLGAAPPIASAADWDWSSPAWDAFANYVAVTAGAAEEGALLSTGFVRGPSVEVRPSPPFIAVGGGPGRRTQTWRLRGRRSFPEQRRGSFSGAARQEITFCFFYKPQESLQL